MNLIYHYVYSQLDDALEDYHYDSETIDNFTKIVMRRMRKAISPELEADRFISGFMDRFEYCENYLKEKGYSEEDVNSKLKHLAANYRDNSFLKIMNMVSVMGLEQEVFNRNYNILKSSPELLHARYKYLLSIGYENDVYNALTMKAALFSKKFGVHDDILKRQYPLTEEAIKVQYFLVSKDEEYIQENYGVTKEQISIIYPDSKNTLGLLKKINKLTDREINGMFGLSRERILSTPLLDFEKAKAVNNIHSFSDRRIQELLGLKKQLVLENSQDWIENSKTLNKK